jgi:hypothetical protein
MIATESPTIALSALPNESGPTTPSTSGPKMIPE